MCFRPPDVTSGPLICPACEKKIVSPNFTPVTCPYCKAPLPGAPEVPTSPQAPSSPSAPKPPTE